MEKIDPVAELPQSKPTTHGGRHDPAHMKRMADKAAEVKRITAQQRREQEAAIDKNPPKSPRDLEADALKELAKQLKHRDPRIRKDAMKEVFRLNGQRDGDDPPTEIVYITPAMRDDVPEIEEALQQALAEEIIEQAAHADDERPVKPAFVPMGAE